MKKTLIFLLLIMLAFASVVPLQAHFGTMPHPLEEKALDKKLGFPKARKKERDPRYYVLMHRVTLKDGRVFDAYFKIPHRRDKYLVEIYCSDNPENYNFDGLKLVDGNNYFRFVHQVKGEFYGKLTFEKFCESFLSELEASSQPPCGEDGE